MAGLIEDSGIPQAYLAGDTELTALAEAYDENAERRRVLLAEIEQKLSEVGTLGDQASDILTRMGRLSRPTLN